MKRKVDHSFDAWSRKEEEVIREGQQKFNDIIDKFTCLAYGLPSPKFVAGQGVKVPKRIQRKTDKSDLPKEKKTRKEVLRFSRKASGLPSEIYDDNTIHEEVGDTLKKRKLELGLPEDYRVSEISLEEDSQISRSPQKYESESHQWKKKENEENKKESVIKPSQIRKNFKERKGLHKDPKEEEKKDCTQKLCETDKAESPKEKKTRKKVLRLSRKASVLPSGTDDDNNTHEEVGDTLKKRKLKLGQKNKKEKESSIKPLKKRGRPKKRKSFQKGPKEEDKKDCTEKLRFMKIIDLKKRKSTPSKRENFKDPMRKVQNKKISKTKNVSQVLEKLGRGRKTQDSFKNHRKSPVKATATKHLDHSKIFMAYVKNIRALEINPELGHIALNESLDTYVFPEGVNEKMNMPVGRIIFAVELTLTNSANQISKLCNSSDEESSQKKKDLSDPVIDKAQSETKTSQGDDNLRDTAAEMCQMVNEDVPTGSCAEENLAKVLVSDVLNVSPNLKSQIKIKQNEVKDNGQVKNNESPKVIPKEKKNKDDQNDALIIDNDNIVKTDKDTDEDDLIFDTPHKLSVTKSLSKTNQQKEAEVADSSKLYFKKGNTVDKEKSKSSLVGFLHPENNNEEESLVKNKKETYEVTPIAGTRKNKAVQKKKVESKSNPSTVFPKDRSVVQQVPGKESMPVGHSASEVQQVSNLPVPGCQLLPTKNSDNLKSQRLEKNKMAKMKQTKSKGNCEPSKHISQKKKDLSDPVIDKAQSETKTSQGDDNLRDTAAEMCQMVSEDVPTGSCAEENLAKVLVSDVLNVSPNLKSQIKIKQNEIKDNGQVKNNESPKVIPKEKKNKDQNDALIIDNDNIVETDKDTDEDDLIFDTPHKLSVTKSLSKTNQQKEAEVAVSSKLYFKKGNTIDKEKSKSSLVGFLHPENNNEEESLLKNKKEETYEVTPIAGTRKNKAVQKKKVESKSNPSTVFPKDVTDLPSTVVRDALGYRNRKDFKPSLSSKSCRSSSGDDSDGEHHLTADASKKLYPVKMKKSKRKTPCKSVLDRRREKKQVFADDELDGDVIVSHCGILRQRELPVEEKSYRSTGKRSEFLEVKTFKKKAKEMKKSVTQKTTKKKDNLRSRKPYHKLKSHHSILICDNEGENEIALQSLRKSNGLKQNRKTITSEKHLFDGESVTKDCVFNNGKQMLDNSQKFSKELDYDVNYIDIFGKKDLSAVPKTMSFNVQKCQSEIENQQLHEKNCSKKLQNTGISRTLEYDGPYSSDSDESRTCSLLPVTKSPLIVGSYRSWDRYKEVKKRTYELLQKSTEKSGQYSTIIHGESKTQTKFSSFFDLSDDEEIPSKLHPIQIVTNKTNNSSLRLQRKILRMAPNVKNGYKYKGKIRDAVKYI